MIDVTETENQIRKKWLFWAIKLPGFMTGCFIAMTLISSFISAGFVSVMVILAISLFSLVGFYVSYHCAYKNPGTVFLLLMLIGIALNLGPALFKNLVIMKISMLLGLCLLPLLFYQLIVLYYTYKLRKVNKQIKERRLITSPVYVRAISVFSTAANMEELDAQFTELQASEDLKGSVAVLVKAYKLHKKKLA